MNIHESKVEKINTTGSSEVGKIICPSNREKQYQISEKCRMGNQIFIKINIFVCDELPMRMNNPFFKLSILLFMIYE